MSLPALIPGTASRKVEHVKVVLGTDVQFRKKTTMFEDVRLIPKGGTHSGDFAYTIDTNTDFLGRKIAAPIFVSGMTGGHDKVAKINMDIAGGVSEVGIPMGVGSQRAMMEHPELAYTYDVKKEHKDVILLGNIGASHAMVYSVKQIKEMLDKVDADFLCIHTNPGQEAAQVGGDIKYKGALKAISDVAENIDRKVIVKEVGNGISKEVAAMLAKTKVAGIDTGGAGGTNWIAVELYRAGGTRSMDIYRDWGLPTAGSLLEVKSAFDGFVTATGGIRTGVDIAKAIALGADACGLAYPVLKAQSRGGAKGVADYLRHIIMELKVEMARLNCKDINELRGVGYTTHGQLKHLLEQRVGRSLLQREPA